MRSVIVLTTIIAVILVSCKKEHSTTPVTPPPVNSKKILLKDVIIPNLPSPYYHFEYGVDSAVTKASFASEFFVYNVIYNGSRIGEMRSDVIANHDTLKYLYDNTGKVTLIKFSNEQGVVYRRVFFTYEGQSLKEVEWDHKDGNIGYLIDRRLTLSYYADGNLKEIREWRPATTTQPEANYVTQFENYDDKINVDHFSLLHEAFQDHLFMLPGTRLQKNNPRKEIRTGAGVNYIADYTYTYKSDGAPLTKASDVLFTSGPQSGQRFQSVTSFSYY